MAVNIKSKENKIVIKSSSGLSEEEIKKMEDDAELHAEEDKKLRELVDTKNLAEGMIHSIKKTMTDNQKINILMDLLEEIKSSLDTECCQTLMDADNISLKIENTLKKINH